MTDEERRNDPRWQRILELARTINRRQAEGATFEELAALYEEKRSVARAFHGIAPE